MVGRLPLSLLLLTTSSSITPVLGMGSDPVRFAPASRSTRRCGIQYTAPGMVSAGESTCSMQHTCSMSTRQGARFRAAHAPGGIGGILHVSTHGSTIASMQQAAACGSLGAAAIHWYALGVIGWPSACRTESCNRLAIAGASASLSWGMRPAATSCVRLSRVTRHSLAPPDPLISEQP